MTLVGSSATHYVRHATNDYLYGALMGLSIIVMLVIPVFKKRLVETTADETAPQPQSVLKPQPV